MSDLEHRLARLAYRVRWSVVDAVFLATCLEYPQWSAPGDYPLEAINALKQFLRHTLDNSDGTA